jgi:hypothetical protein
MMPPPISVNSERSASAKRGCRGCLRTSKEAPADTASRKTTWLLSAALPVTRSGESKPSPCTSSGDGSATCSNRSPRRPAGMPLRAISRGASRNPAPLPARREKTRSRGYARFCKGVATTSEASECRCYVTRDTENGGFAVRRAPFAAAARPAGMNHLSRSGIVAVERLQFARRGLCGAVHRWVVGALLTPSVDWTPGIRRFPAGIPLSGRPDPAA